MTCELMAYFDNLYRTKFTKLTTHYYSIMFYQNALMFETHKIHTFLSDIILKYKLNLIIIVDNMYILQMQAL